MPAEGAGGAEGVAWNGEDLVLHPEGAVGWPREGTLFLADLHLGKGEVFRSRGVPVPTGDTREDVARLDRLVDRTGAGRVVILGDLFHGHESRAPYVEEALARWRHRRPGVDLLLVRGNHDRVAGDPHPSLGVRVEAGPVRMGPFELRHHPPDDPEAGALPSDPPEGRPVLAGHLHPVVRLRGPGRDRARLPCFWLRPRTLVLPAWGRFTGGHAVPVRRGDRVFVAAGGSVVEVEVG